MILNCIYWSSISGDLGRIQSLLLYYYSQVHLVVASYYSGSIYGSERNLSRILHTIQLHTNYTYYIHTYIRGSLNKFPDFFVWALLLIVHTWNSSPLRSNLLRLQCTCCTVPTTSRRPHGSPLVWACQWPSSQPLSSPQLSHNDSLWLPYSSHTSHHLLQTPCFPWISYAMQKLMLDSCKMFQKQSETFHTFLRHFFQV